MKIVECRACKAHIVFMPTMRGKLCPVDLDSIPVPENSEPDRNQYIALMPDTTVFNRNVHMSHFLTCPEAARFKKSKPAPEPVKPEPDAVQESLL